MRTPISHGSQSIPRSGLISRKLSEKPGGPYNSYPQARLDYGIFYTASAMLANDKTMDA